MSWKEAFGPQVLQPRWSGPALQFFSDANALCRHLAKHMLTHPESLAWSVAFSSLDYVVPADDRDRLWRMRQAMGQQSEPPPELVAIYRDAIREAWEDAEQMDWIVTIGDVLVGFGTSAVLVLAERDGQRWFQRTAFLPGHGEPAEPRRELRSRRDASVGPYEPIHVRLLKRRAQAWTAQQRHYYLVFRVAVQAIRERHWTRSEWNENARPCDYALLKSKLPSPSQQIDDWLAARQRCGRMP